MEHPTPGPLRESATATDEAVWTGAHQNDLPDSAFAYIEPGGSKDEDGKTKPRTLRHLPYKSADGKVDSAHVRNALQRLPTTQISADAKASARKKLVAAAKSVGVEVSDEEDAKESAFAPPALGKTKVATLRTVFLEDGAVSLNGRQYNREAVDKLIQSAQVQLSEPDAAPLTCYISHDAADQDNSLMLAGKITNVWREGTKAWAAIDLVNTNAGRDMATQAAGGFMRTMSLRASNAEIKREKDSTWPTVGGSSLRLDGIDFTASPGISVAKIQNVALSENAFQGPQRLHEVFNAHAHLVEIEQKEKGMDKLNEAEQGGNTVGGYSPTSGNSPYMTSDPTKDSYGARLYNKPDDTTGGPMQGMDKQGSALELIEAHDRIAMVQGRSCAPSRESRNWKLALGGMTESERQETERLWQLIEAGKAVRVTEAGKPINAKNDGHLDVAHDNLARHMGMACEGKQNKMRAAQPANDGLQDGDDDDQQSARPTGGVKEQQHKQKEQEQMTPEEAAKLLEAAGYKIEKPKSADEQLHEKLEAAKAEQTQQLEVMREAMKAEQAQQLKELLAQFQSSQPDPQRKSRVLAGNVSEPANRPLHGRYMQEQIRGLDWHQLADRTAPLPTEKVPLDLLMKQFEHLYALQYDIIYDPQGTKYSA